MRHKHTFISIWKSINNWDYVCKGFKEIVRHKKREISLKKTTKVKLQLAHKYIICRDWCFFLVPTLCLHLPPMALSRGLKSFSISVHYQRALKLHDIESNWSCSSSVYFRCFVSFQSVGARAPRLMTSSIFTTLCSRITETTSDPSGTNITLSTSTSRSTSSWSTTW